MQHMFPAKNQVFQFRRLIFLLRQNNEMLEAQNFVAKRKKQLLQVQFVRCQYVPLILLLI